METTANKYKTVFITRTFDLPIDTIWAAWTEPESFKKWWGPKDYTCPICEIDLRVGGRVFASMKGPDGVEIFSVGTYQEIIPKKKIVVTDNFADSEGNITSPPPELPGEWPNNGGKTNMTMKQEPMPAEMYDDCVAGWQQCLDKMESNLK